MMLKRIFQVWQASVIAAVMWAGMGQGICAPAQVNLQTSATVVAAANTNTNRVEINVEPERKQSLSFGLDRVEVLQPLFFGNPRWQYVASLIYVLLAFAVAKLLDFLLRVELKKWTGRTKTQFDDLVLDLIRGPVKIVAFVLLLHLGLNIFNWPDWVGKIFSKTLLVVVAFSLTYAALKFVDLLMQFWKNRLAGGEDKLLDEQLLPVIRNSLKVFLVIVAVLVTSQNLGMNVTGVLASLSIGGLALGLAAQDTLANLFGAVSVFADKPFRIGDYVKLSDAEGTVESIGLRSTRLRNPDGHLITIPNKTMGNASITNVTRRPRIKTTMNIGLTYNTDAGRMKQALEILKDIYTKHPMTADVWVSFNQFADSALNIQVIHWWNNTDQKSYLAGMQEMNLQVKERFDAAGLEFAFPSRTIYLRQEVDAGNNRTEITSKSSA